MKPPPPVATVLSKNQESDESMGQFLCSVDLQSLLHSLSILYAYPALCENSFNLSLRSLSRTLTLSHFLPDIYIKIPADCLQPPTPHPQTP